MTSPLAICPDPTTSEDTPEALDSPSSSAIDSGEQDEADWYDDEAIGGGSSGFADAPQGW